MRNFEQRFAFIFATCATFYHHRHMRQSRGGRSNIKLWYQISIWFNTLHRMQYTRMWMMAKTPRMRMHNVYERFWIDGCGAAPVNHTHGRMQICVCIYTLQRVTGEYCILMFNKQFCGAYRACLCPVSVHNANRRPTNICQRQTGTMSENESRENDS